jgi:hypothetical protein
MKQADDMGSGAMIYIPSFVKTGSGIQKFIRWIQRYRHTDNNMISEAYLYLFKIRKVG